MILTRIRKLAADRLADPSTHKEINALLMWNDNRSVDTWESIPGRPYAPLSDDDISQFSETNTFIVPLSKATDFSIKKYNDPDFQRYSLYINKKNINTYDYFNKQDPTTARGSHIMLYKFGLANLADITKVQNTDLLYAWVLHPKKIVAKPSTTIEIGWEIFI